MEGEIKSLFLDYCKQKRFIDSYFINQVFIIISNYLHIDEYLKNIFVKNGSSFNDSFYNSMEKVIFFDLKNEHDKYHRNKLDYDNYVYWYNLHVLRTIFHELEHIKQEVYKYSYNFDIKQKLVVLNDIKPNTTANTLKERIENYLRGYKYYRYYQKNHDLSPIERMANIKASKYINSFMDQLENNNEGITKFRLCDQYDILNKVRYGYHLVSSLTNSPSIDFIISIHEKVKDKHVNLNSLLPDMSLSFDDRLYYGLELTEEEYAMIDDDDYIKEFIKRC